jgi:hypothetical protein
VPRLMFRRRESRLADVPQVIVPLRHTLPRQMRRGLKTVGNPAQCIKPSRDASNWRPPPQLLCSGPADRAARGCRARLRVPHGVAQHGQAGVAGHGDGKDAERLQDAPLHQRVPRRRLRGVIVRIRSYRGACVHPACIACQVHTLRPLKPVAHERSAELLRGAC